MSYMSEELTATKRRRAHRVEATNPAEGDKSIKFFEEDFTLLSNGTKINTPQGTITAALIDPSITFELVNPADDSPLGQQMTYGEVYCALHSLYLALATARDIAQAN